MKSIILTFALFNVCISNLHGQFASDIIIDNNPSIIQSNVCVTTAFNGWIFTAFTTFNSANNSSGITIKKSTDRGESWSIIAQNSLTNIEYQNLEIEVAGTSTADLKLFVIGSNFSSTTSSFTTFLDVYNAVTGTYIGTPHFQSHGTKIYDLDIATDYISPASVSSPYSIGFLYSKTAAVDSIVFVGSIDGGVTFGIRNVVATTPLFFNKISLSYGQSFSGSNGRYFAAWEQKSSNTARNGHIYTSRNVSTVDGPWISPVNLDSLSSTMINLCRNPRISTMIEPNTDSDSAGVTSIVLVDRDYNGDASDYDLLGFYNKRSHYTNFWTRLDVSNTSENDMYSDITYNPQNNSFSTTYFDSTSNLLILVDNDLNLLTPNLWTIASSQYNDGTAGIAPSPRISYNPQENGTDAVWNASTATTNGVAKFDASYRGLYLDISEGTFNSMQVSCYPNPAVEKLTIDFNSKTDNIVFIELIDLTGKVIQTQSEVVVKGENKLELKFNTIASGTYILQVSNTIDSFKTNIVIK
jgi:hypothetical protein